MEPLNLTPDEIKTWQELSADNHAMEDNFRIMLDYYHNQKNEEYKRNRKFWNKLAEKMDVSLSTHILKIEEINNALSVTATEKGDKVEDPAEHLPNSDGTKLV